MNPLHQLYHLQEIDSEIRAKKERLREVLQLQKRNAALEEARAWHEQTMAALSEARSRQKALEFELNQVAGKRQRSEERLYSGKVRNPKELADLQQEIDSLGRRRSDLEDELLEAMLDVESAQEADEAAGTRREALETEWEAQKAALAREQDELATRLNTLLAQRQERSGRVDNRYLSAYESTRSKRSGVGVAVVEGDMCTACGVRASSSKVRTARDGELVRCGSCDRIFVIL